MLSFEIISSKGISSFLVCLASQCVAIELYGRMLLTLEHLDSSATIAKIVGKSAYLTFVLAVDAMLERADSLVLLEPSWLRHPHPLAHHEQSMH